MAISLMRIFVLPVGLGFLCSFGNVKEEKVDSVCLFVVDIAGFGILVGTVSGEGVLKRDLNVV